MTLQTGQHENQNFYVLYHFESKLGWELSKTWHWLNRTPFKYVCKNKWYFTIIIICEILLFSSNIYFELLLCFVVDFPFVKSCFYFYLVFVILSSFMSFISFVCIASHSFVYSSQLVDRITMVLRCLSFFSHPTNNKEMGFVWLNKRLTSHLEQKQFHILFCADVLLCVCVLRKYTDPMNWIRCNKRPISSGSIPRRKSIVYQNFCCVSFHFFVLLNI